jgi:hypothetical protein
MQPRTCFLTASILLLAAADVPAVTYSVTLRKDEFADPPGGAFTLTFTNVPVPLAGGTLRVRAAGDLDNNLGTEYLNVSVEGVQFGPLFNREPFDDRFDNTGSGHLGLFYSPVSSIASFSLSEIQSWTGNGSVAVTIAPSASVGNDVPGEFVEVTLAYEAQALSAACCFAAGETCQDLNVSECTNQGGVYAGDGTTCATHVCFPKGACCLPNETCTGDQVSPEACAAMNGLFQGHGSTCAASDCRIKGSCCLAGECTLETAEDCGLTGGTYGGDHSACGGDTDGDTVPDACDLCPGTPPGTQVDDNGCPPQIPGDFNHDGDVDKDDFIELTGCDSRDGVNFPPGCSAKDLDGDGDVDLNDFGIFQRCYSGANQPGDPECNG